MAKARITTAAGIKITIDGTPKEIATIIEDLRGKAEAMRSAPRSRKSKPGRVLLGDLIATLKDGGFFKKPRDLASVKSALEEMGHHYPVTTLSPVMLRKVRKQTLRRIREKGRWLYNG